jgi:NADH-quinone oxidoreductase subunit H
MSAHFAYGQIGFELLATVAKILVFIILFAMGLASFMTWLERRESAMIQDRVGPNRANIGRFRAWGLLHFVADALKMMFKEDFIPPKANRFLFTLAPMLALAPPLIVLAIIPFGAPLCWDQVGKAVPAGACAMPVNLQIAHLDVGVLFYFAFASLSVFGITLAGWASHNKWALMGGMRAASQMISYEVTMGMAVLAMFMSYSTLEPGAMVAQQGWLPWQWGIVRGVPHFFAFLLFLIAAMAETKRTPFDLPEGESEIVGYFVEYSGLRFGMFYLAEFIEVIGSSALIVTIFLGGWHIPGAGHLPNWLFVVLSMLVWGGKVFLFCAFQLAVRWTLPRFRIDQLLRLGWQRLLPLSIANVVFAALWHMWVH